MSAESTANPEAQPLLSPFKPPTYHDEPVQDPSRPAGGSDEESNDTLVADDADAPKPRSWSTIAFQFVVVLLSLTVVALFIKGFIDADDVEVWFCLVSLGVTHSWLISMSQFDLSKALMSALGGGLSGAAAMVLQVFTLMPLRTVMNYQYRYGTTTTEAIKTLYADGGWTRYYQGLAAALIQGPVSRFGDTAANAGILALLQSNTFMRRLPTLVKTVFASVACGMLQDGSNAG
ncbi:hypothetical protein J3R82DRAFT_7565 [Butyriboletus roseoflavus]|nr:hypothetical protein J3R82DRAFT_7565 [Butyriboletus roseoflavus]